MNRATKTRQEITPLRVPWLQHEQFPVTKLACSTDDGLVTSTKRSLIKIVQELKRGRANLDKQLAQLDNQLVVLSDYLDGKSSNMFPPQLIINVENEPESPAQSTVDGRRHCGAAVAGKFSGILNTEPASPTPAMVEDDLNSDSPCSTIGLWKYLHAYSFFKTITPEDMDQALQLEGLSDDFEVREDGIDHHSKIVDLERYQEKNNSSKFATHDLDEFFKERLVASLCELETPEVLTRAIEKESLFQREVEEEKSSRTGETQSDTVASQLLRSIDVRSCNSKGLTKTLHSIGLVEKSETEIAQVGLSRPTDDEVSQEIRLLQRQLDSCVRETNETKRKLRKRMNETNPWLRREREEEETIIKTYFTMWQTKKELARKRKLREKKRQRRRGYGGGTSGNPPLDNVSRKRR